MYKNDNCAMFLKNNDCSFQSRHYEIFICFPYLVYHINENDKIIVIKKISIK